MSMLRSPSSPPDLRAAARAARAATPTGDSPLAGLVGVAAAMANAPLAVLSLEDAGAQRLRVRAGPGAAGDEPRRALLEALCARVAAGGSGVEAPAGNLAFLGVPVRAAGVPPGALALLAPGPRSWTEAERGHLRALAAAVGSELERARLRAEHDELTARVRESEERYARLARASRLGIYAIDLEGRVAELNEVAAEMLGRPVADVLGQDFLRLFAPEDRDRAVRVFEERLSGEACDGEAELRVVRPTGERRLVRLCSTQVVQGGVPVGTYGVARDVTEERAREVQFRRAERMASVAPLLSGVCHELNNPLTSIQSFAELLLLDERTAEDREALEVVQREARRAAKIVTDLRVVARRQEAGTGREMVDLSAVVRRLIEAQCALVAGLRLTLDLTDGLPPVWAVRAHVEEVALQLVENAVQSMRGRDGPRELAVRTYAGGVGVVLQVEDTGEGIDPGHLDRIFDPFWTTRRPGEGTGLGLSVVQGIVGDHGGRVRVDSVVGRGTGFLIELPVAAEPPAHAAEPEVERSRGRPLRILVVDDEPAIRYSVVRYLERRGHEVRQVGEAGTALRLVEGAGADTYDAIVADLRVPGLGARALLERLRRHPAALHERLILKTGGADDARLDPCVAECDVPVVRKPFELAELAQIIETQAEIAAL